MDWKKFKNFLLNSDLSYRDINNTDDIDNADINFQNLITTAQKHATYIKNNNYFTLPHYIYIIFVNKEIISGDYSSQLEILLSSLLYDMNQNRLNNKIKNYCKRNAEKLK